MTTKEASSDTKSAEYDAGKISSLIRPHVGIVDKCRNKNVFFPLGPSQGGKSVLCNVIRFGVMKKKFDKEARCVRFSLRDDCQTDPSTQPLAATGDGKKSCTTIPDAYSIPDEVFGKDYEIIDPKGAFDSKQDPIEDAAATVLAELALQEVRSVKLAVVLNASETIQKEDRGLNPLSDLFGQVLLDDNATVVYVFNRIHVPEDDEETREILDQLKNDPPARYEFIMNFMKDSVLRALESKQKNWSDSLKRITEKFKSLRGPTAKLTDSPEYKKELNSQRFLRQLALAFGLSPDGKKETTETTFRSYVCYLDPTDSYSVMKVLEALRSVEPVNPKYLSFSNYCGPVESYKNTMRNCLPQFTTLLEARSLLTELPKEVVEGLAKGRKKDSKRHQRDLEGIKLIGDDTAKREELEQKYRTEIEGYSGRIKKMKIEAKGKIKEAERRKLRADVLDHDDTPVSFRKYAWRRVSYDDVNEVYYKDKIPYVEVKEELEAPTRRYETIKDESPEFDVKYIAGSTAKKIGAALLFPLYMFGVGETVSEGCVTIYIKKCLHPDTRATVKSILEDCSQLRDDALKLDKEIEKLERTGDSDLNKVISKMRQNALNDVVSLKHFVEVENELEAVLAKRGKSMETYFEVVEKLFPGSELFENPLKKFKLVKQEEEGEPETVASLDSVLTYRIDDLRDTISSLFPTTADHQLQQSESFCDGDTDC